MRILAADVIRVRLRLHRPLHTAHGPIPQRDGVLLRLVGEDGICGFGESFPLPGFGMEGVDSLQDRVRRLADTVTGRRSEERDALIDASEEHHPDAPGARAALDLALHDLAARVAGVGVASLLGSGALPPAVAISGLLDAHTPEEAARQALASRATALKLKLASGTAAEVARTCARLVAVRDAVGSQVALRVDANGCLAPDHALDALAALAAAGATLIEEPLAAPDPARLAALRAAAPLAIAADESLRHLADAEKLLAADAVDAFVLKPAVVGGLRAARRIAARAHAAGVRVIVTSFLDSAIGVAGALHLAASLSAPREPAGLATGSLLRDDLAAPFVTENGWLTMPSAPGLGRTPDAARVMRTAAAIR